MVISITDNSTALGLAVPQIYINKQGELFENVVSSGMVGMFTPCFLPASGSMSEIEPGSICQTQQSCAPWFQIKLPYTQRYQDKFSWV